MLRLPLNTLQDTSINLVDAYPQLEPAQACKVSACNWIRMPTQLRWDR